MGPTRAMLAWMGHRTACRQQQGELAAWGGESILDSGGVRSAGTVFTVRHRAARRYDEGLLQLVALAGSVPMPATRACPMRTE